VLRVGGFRDVVGWVELNMGLGSDGSIEEGEMERASGVLGEGAWGVLCKGWGGGGSGTWTQVVMEVVKVNAHLMVLLLSLLLSLLENYFTKMVCKTILILHIFSSTPIPFDVSVLMNVAGVLQMAGSPGFTRSECPVQIGWKSHVNFRMTNAVQDHYSRDEKPVGACVHLMCLVESADCVGICKLATVAAEAAIVVAKHFMYLLLLLLWA
jgi:hypothetical protein